MRKKYLSALLFGALLVTSAGTFTSCKDYDDEINNLQEQIDVIKTDLASLTETVKNLDGVKDMSFDKETGKLYIETGEGKKVEVNIPSATGIAKIELKDNVLYVNDEPKGEVVIPEDKDVVVEVRDDGKLYIDDQVQDLEIGSKVVMVDNGDYYTMTIDGKESYNLPKYNAAALISSLYVIENLTFGFKSGTETESSSAPIQWGYKDAKVTWKGPKGDVAANKLMVGSIGKAVQAIKVSPYNIDMSSMTLKLVDSKGAEAPVEINAVANDDILTTTRANENGVWDLEMTIKESVTKGNIKSTFDVGNDMKSKLYALSVNGKVMTDYSIVVDVAVAMGAAIPDANGFSATSTTAGSQNKNIIINYEGQTEAKKINVTAVWASSTGSVFDELSLGDLKIGSTTITFDGTYSNVIYDAYIELTDADKAGRYEVTVNGMTVTATDKAVQQTIPAKIHILDVTGKETVIPVEFVFGSSTVEGEVIANQSFVAMPNKAYFIVDLGNTFSSLTDEQADKVNDHITWTVDKDAKTLTGGEILAGNIKYYETAEKAEKAEVGTNLTMEDVSTIKKAKFARIDLDATDKDNATETGLNKVTITLKDNAGNEVKKVSTELTFTAPTFDELVTANTEYALWNNGEYTTRMTYSPSASASTLVPMDKAFISNVTDDSKPGYVDIDDETHGIKYTHKYTNASGTEVTVGVLSSIVNAGKKLANQLSTEASITIRGKIKVSKKFTVNLLSIFEGAKLSYYVDGNASDVAIVGGNSLITPYSVDTNTPAKGLAIEFNKDIVPVEFTNDGEDNLMLTVGGISITDKLSTAASEANKPTAGNWVWFSANSSPSSKGQAEVTNDGIKINSLNEGEKGKLVLKFRDANGVETETSINYVK